MLTQIRRRHWFNLLIYVVPKVKIFSSDLDFILDPSTRRKLLHVRTAREISKCACETVTDEKIPMIVRDAETDVLNQCLTSSSIWENHSPLLRANWTFGWLKSLRLLVWYLSATLLTKDAKNQTTLMFLACSNRKISKNANWQTAKLRVVAFTADLLLFYGWYEKQPFTFYILYKWQPSPFTSRRSNPSIIEATSTSLSKCPLTTLSHTTHVLPLSSETMCCFWLFTLFKTYSIFIYLFHVLKIRKIRISGLRFFFILLI